MRWVTVCSVLHFTVIEVIVVTDGVDVTILYIGMDGVVVLLLWLDSEGDVIEEPIGVFWVKLKLGALDRGAREEIGLTTRFWCAICFIGGNELRFDKFDRRLLVSKGGHVEEFLHDYRLRDSSCDQVIIVDL